MAITAVCTIGDSTLAPEEGSTVTCTVTNGNASAVNVTGLQPHASPASGTRQTVSVALGIPPLAPMATVSVAAAGTGTFSYGFLAHAPRGGNGLAEPSSYIYDVGCTVYTSDGSITEATVVAVTVTAPAH